MEHANIDGGGGLRFGLLHIYIDCYTSSRFFCVRAVDLPTDALVLDEMLKAQSSSATTWNAALCLLHAQ